MTGSSGSGPRELRAAVFAVSDKSSAIVPTNQMVGDEEYITSFRKTAVCFLQKIKSVTTKNELDAGDPLELDTEGGV